MISVRLTKSLRDILDIARGEESYSKFIQALLLRKVEEVRGYIIGNAYQKGYAEAKMKYEITYPCASCGKPATVVPESEAHEDIKKYLKDEGWVHGECME